MLLEGMGKSPMVTVGPPCILVGFLCEQFEDRVLGAYRRGHVRGWQPDPLLHKDRSALDPLPVGPAPPASF